MLVNFSDAVKPKPAMTIYIIDSNNLESTVYPQILATNPPEHIKNASIVTVLLLETVPLALSDNMLVIKLIYNSGCAAGAGPGFPPNPVTT